MDGGEESVELEGLISLLFHIFKDDIEGLIDIGNIVAVYENHIKNAHPTQGITMNRPSSWSELLQVVGQLPIEDAFSQLLRCITSSQENLLHILHLDNRRDLPRLHRLQLSVPASLPAALQRDVFAQSLQDFSKSSEDLDGDGSAAHVHRVLRQLIDCAPHDWFEHLILAAIADLESSVDLLNIIAPFGQNFESELPALQPKLYNTVSSPEFEEAKKSVVDQSNRWFDLNGLKFDSDTYKLERIANQQPPSPPGSQPSGNNELVGRQLRDYQLELAEPALLGRNSIVIAPTGSGKTLVAVYVALRLLKAEPQAKVAFLASTTNLVQQQYEEFRSVLPPPWHNSVCPPVHGGADSRNRMPFAQALKGHSIIVMSTQILLNALKREPDSFNGLGVSAFRLIIFDECHNCSNDHPSKGVMVHYMRRKKILESSVEEQQKGSKLPQILGLTASPGTGKASRLEAAVEHLIKLCANLDCPYPVTVQRCIKSLNEVTSNPDCQIHYAPGDPTKVDVFINLLNRLMNMGEGLLRDYCDSLEQWQSEGLPVSSVPPRGTPAYLNYCTNVKYNMHNITDQTVCKNILACSRYLGCCNEAQMIAQCFRAVDALRYLETELRTEDEMAKPPASEAEERLRRHLDDVMQQLIRFCGTKEASSSPPLDKLVEILREQFTGQPNSRAIVFVKQKFYARVLADFVDECAELRLKATYVTGATSGESTGGTNAAEQRARLEDFRRGLYKVIACTSVTEEGLDIPDCNLVVRYCHVTNEVSMVQTKGRGRARNSAYHVIVAETQEWLKDKERINQERDAMMSQAVRTVAAMSARELEIQMLEYQVRMMNTDEDNQEAGGGDVNQANNNRGQVLDSDHDILCSKCFTQLSHSTRLRLIGDIHRVVVDVEMFASGGRLRGQAGGEAKRVPGVEVIGVDLVCDSCGFKVAKVVSYGRLFFPLLTVEAVLFRRSITMETERPARKWKATESFLRPVARLSQEDKNLWRRHVPRLPEHYRPYWN
ncbi:hypothetical protein BOX15_Mlig016200g2 [Macrostomum lignano]|uniref:RNA helicase n=2 Tax=Macrostomum lignano TaxID=282301 RepID=A0A267DEA4_9PLAT|nr:hypothetical protein BOX15_Mlig016200g2 [Macrostomum lignano]